LEIAIEKGQVAENPLNARGVKLSAKSKKVNLPDPTALNSLFAEIERRGKLGGRGGGRTADFCRFLAFTGCRLSEATATRWQDVNFITGTLTINGTKTDAAARTIPMVPAARTLLEKLNAERVSPENVTAPLFSIRSAKKALKAACDALKLPRLTHHDLRDAFATTCIEGGVDIPTVAAWLGHVDGGALLMKVYAHHRMPHSLAQAAKVSFGEK
jgi:integrase